MKLLAFAGDLTLAELETFRIGETGFALPHTTANGVAVETGWLLNEFVDAILRGAETKRVGLSALDEGGLGVKALKHERLFAETQTLLVRKAASVSGAVANGGAIERSAAIGIGIDTELVAHIIPVPTVDATKVRAVVCLPLRAPCRLPQFIVGFSAARWTAPKGSHDEYE